MLSRNNDHCARPLSVPAAALHFPFCQRNFFRGYSSEPRQTQFLRCLEMFQPYWGTNLPFWFSLNSEVRKKGDADGSSGGGRVVRRLRRKCQRKWALCLDGSVSWPRKLSFSRPLKEEGLTSVRIPELQG